MVGTDSASEPESVPGSDELYVCNHDAYALIVQELFGFLDRPGLEHTEAVELQVDAADDPHRRMVIDDQDRRGPGPRDFPHDLKDPRAPRVSR